MRYPRPLGSLLRPDSLSVGDALQAECKDGFYYNARVISKDRSGTSTSVEVRFVGFPASHNESYVEADRKLRVRRPAAELRAEQQAEHECRAWRDATEGQTADGRWLVERIVRAAKRKGRKMYVVRWEGYGPEGDTVEPASNIPPEIIEEYEDLKETLAEARRNPAKQPKTPFSQDLVADETPEHLEFRMRDVAELLAALRAEAGRKLASQKTCVAELKVYTCRPVSAGAFVALREQLARRALAAQPHRVVTEAVEPIVALRRGRRPVDFFSVNCDDLVNGIMGDAVLIIQATTNRAAVKLVPPFDLFLRARRGPDGEIEPVKELVVKAHAVALVPNHANPNDPVFRYDDASFDYPVNDVAAYKKAMAARLLQVGPAGGVVPAFAAWAALQ